MKIFFVVLFLLLASIAEGATFFTNPGSPQQVNTSIGLQASGGSYYWFGVQDSSGSWVAIQDWSTNSGALWYPTIGGQYTLGVIISNSFRQPGDNASGSDQFVSAPFSISGPSTPQPTLPPPPPPPSCVPIEISASASVPGNGSRVFLAGLNPYGSDYGFPLFIPQGFLFYVTDVLFSGKYVNHSGTRSSGVVIYGIATVHDPIGFLSPKTPLKRRGPFWIDGNFTNNSPEEQNMIANVLGWVEPPEGCP